MDHLELCCSSIAPSVPGREWRKSDDQRSRRDARVLRECGARERGWVPRAADWKYKGKNKNWPKKQMTDLDTILDTVEKVLWYSTGLNRWTSCSIILE